MARVLRGLESAPVSGARWSLSGSRGLQAPGDPGRDALATSSHPETGRGAPSLLFPEPRVPAPLK